MADLVTASQGVLENLKVNVPDIANAGKDLTRALATPLAPKGTNVDQLAEHVIDRTWDVSFRAVAAVALVTVGWLISTWLASKTQEILLKLHVEETLAAFLGSMVRFVFFFSTFITGMIVVGVNSTTLAAVLGATGLAVGLALKGTLGHVASGMMLMVHRPFKVGDWVETTGGIQGAVKRIGLFSTEINSLDNKRLFIPNTVLWDNVIFNHSYQRTRMLEFKFTLSYLSDIDKAFVLIREVLDAHAAVLKMPEPVLGLTALTPLGAECTLRVWFKSSDYALVQFTLLGLIYKALTGAGIGLAMQPQTLSSFLNNQALEAEGKVAALAAQPQPEAPPPAPTPKRK